MGGSRVPVTKITAGPIIITQIKNMKTDGYWSVQVGFLTKKTSKTSKPLQGHLKKIAKDDKAPKTLREIRLDTEPDKAIGDEIKVSEIFNVGDLVSVSGISKGKGFAGVVKRHGFRGGPRTHGQSDRERAPGSIGQTTTPGRVYKGKRMAGRMGSTQVTVKNLKVISINPETNEIEISGQVPGSIGTLLRLNKLNA